jgi:hypothetical protein
MEFLFVVSFSPFETEDGKSGESSPSRGRLDVKYHIHHVLRAHIIVQRLETRHNDTVENVPHNNHKNDDDADKDRFLSRGFSQRAI